MKLSNEFMAVLNMIMDLDTKPEGFGFGIPGEILNPDTATTEQSKALEAAGFEWQDTENGGLYFVSLNND
jgi:hypothetical protein